MGTNKCVFLPGPIKKLFLFPKTYKLTIFSVSRGYLELCFTEMCIEQSSILHKTFVQIAEFDRLPGLIFERKC